MISARVSLSQSTLQSSDLRRRGNPIWVRPSSLVKLPRGAGVAACLNLEVKEPRAPRDVGFGDKSKEVMEAEGKVLVGTCARAPVVLASGRGCKLYDVEGQEYLDLSSGIAVNALGYGDPDWVNAVVEQANTLTHVSNVYYSVPQIQCGLGRSGYLWAYEAYGVYPDIMTLAKPLAGGLPIGAVLVTEKVASAMKCGDHGSTFAGSPLVCKADYNIKLVPQHKQSGLSRVVVYNS